MDNNLSDQELLDAYAEAQSEEAFTELVCRYVDLVHSAALRMVCDEQLAQDVTQGAFLALAQNANRLAEQSVLSGWLHRTTHNIASKLIRTEVRRRAREQNAVMMNTLLPHETGADWEAIAPELDAALDDLAEPDRDAIMLRYFQGKSAQQMAEAVGVSAEAAQKRVSRAIERLRQVLGRRGVTVCTAALAAAIPAHAVQAAPVHLSGSIAHAVAHTATPVAVAAVLATSKATIAKVFILAVLAITVPVASYQAMRFAGGQRSLAGTTTASGLKYWVMERGTGTIHPKENDTVSVHYLGTLPDGTVFENSMEQGKPMTVPIGTMIPGWVEGLQLMRRGDKFKFEMPPHLAYGDQARPKIPPNSTLTFEIELLAIQ